MSNEVWKTGALSWSAINAGTASIANTDVIADGIIIYVEGIVNTSQKIVNYKVGVGGTTQYKDLPYKLPVYIEISANTDLTSYNLGVNGNVLVIRNTAATAKTITYAAGVTRSIPAGLTATMKYLGGWTDLINASGVRFPATQVPSSDPNTFDDYEEGIATLGISFGGFSTGASYGLQNGNYQKKGNHVHVNGRFTLTSKGISTGAALITGLPFVSNALNSVSTISFRVVGLTFTGSLQGALGASSTVISLEDLAAGVNSALTDSAFTNTTSIAIDVEYRV